MREEKKATPAAVARSDGVALFTKKPVTISAIQWTGKNLREVIAFTDGPPDMRTTHAGMAWDKYVNLVEREGLKIYTLEGKMLANVGDWIIKGIKGEHYPCKPDIFEATYEPVAAPQPPVAAQEPVASVYTMEALVPGAHPKCHVDLLKPLPAGTKLYTHPAPQPAPVAQPAILGPEHKGMRVDYSGLFKQARGALARGIKEPALAEMLRQFQGHMQELGQRWYAGDTAVIDELLQLYCIEQGARAQAKEGGA